MVDPAIHSKAKEHHRAIIEITDVLCNKTQNMDRGFFQTEVAYFLGKMASCQHATVQTKDRGSIPVNIYALALGTSGFGKGHSVHLLEHEFIGAFKNRFIEETLPVIAEENKWEIANARAARNGTDQNEEYETVEKEYTSSGPYPFTFDSGTGPAVKQLRQKLLISKCGAINLQIDEIGSNLIGNVEVLTTFLELYDQGQIKMKLTKHTNENKRIKEIDGKTPTNMLLFGTPSKLLDGGLIEDQFYDFLETGYARRCIFGFGKIEKKAFRKLTAAEIYANLTQSSNDATIDKWSTIFHALADPSKYGWKMKVEDDVGIRLLEYKIACEKAAEELPEHEEIQKAELSHRYFKVLKLAGAYAFVDSSMKVEMSHIEQAILLVQESGEAFQTILNREKTYEKLAKYIASTGKELTHADLNEALPFYKSGKSARDEMMTMAIAWGYRRHIIIKKSFEDGIEFFKGETLKETNLDEMIVSYSDHFAYNYENVVMPFSDLNQLCQMEGMHWANHHFKNNHRAEENVIPGFNMIVIDVDKGVSLENAKELLKDYKFFTYTTKRHQTEGNGDRFRIVIPINYILELNTEEYKEFMTNILNWLPFSADEASLQRSKKWEAFAGGECSFNMEGEILDALKFIPRTQKNENYLEQCKQISNMDNLERWFAERMASGNRNNQMIKFALALVDSGLDLMNVNTRVHEFNAKLSNPLPEDELGKTIMTTVAKRYQKS